jgi:hypothetical protein
MYRIRANETMEGTLCVERQNMEDLCQRGGYASGMAVQEKRGAAFNDYSLHTHAFFISTTPTLTDVFTRKIENSCIFRDSIQGRTDWWPRFMRRTIQSLALDDEICWTTSWGALAQTVSLYGDHKQQSPVASPDSQSFNGRFAVTDSEALNRKPNPYSLEISTHRAYLVTCPSAEFS